MQLDEDDVAGPEDVGGLADAPPTLVHSSVPIETQRTSAAGQMP